MSDRQCSNCGTKYQVHPITSCVRCGERLEPVPCHECAALRKERDEARETTAGYYNEAYNQIQLRKAAEADVIRLQAAFDEVSGWFPSTSLMRDVFNDEQLDRMRVQLDSWNPPSAGPRWGRLIALREQLATPAPGGAPSPAPQPPPADDPMVVAGYRSCATCIERLERWSADTQGSWRLTRVTNEHHALAPFGVGFGVELMTTAGLRAFEKSGKGRSLDVAVSAAFTRVGYEPLPPAPQPAPRTTP